MALLRDELLRRKAARMRQARARQRVPYEKRLEARLLSYLEPDPNSGCWLYSRSVNHSGYGLIMAYKKSQLAHRLAYRLWSGPLASEQRLLHACDTPSCCNPQHLRIGTQQENIQDMLDKRRHCFGERRPEAKLTTAQVLAIRADTRTGRAIAAAYGVQPRPLRLAVARSTG